MAERQNRTLRNVRYVLWGLVLLIGLAATAVYFLNPPQRPVGLYGGSFTLTSTDGETFTEDDLRGEASLVFFGYTYCPDVCPTTLAESTGWRESLGLSPDELRLIFITVDPDRDTLAGLKTYLDAFGSPIMGLRGDDAATEQAKKAFGVYSEKVEDAGSTAYVVNHTASVFLIDRNGQFQGTIAYGEGRDAALGKIRKLMGS